jgi:hypothetical protein
MLSQQGALFEFMTVVLVACFCRLLALSGPGDPEQSRSKDGHLQRGYRQTGQISPPLPSNTAGNILPYSLIFAAVAAAA